MNFRVGYLFPETATSLTKRAAAYRTERRQHEAWKWPFAPLSSTRATGRP